MPEPIGGSIEEQTDLLTINDGVSAQTFANKQISVRLDDDNFMLWWQQVKLMVRGHGFEHFLDEDTLIPTNIIVSTRGERTMNHAYLKFIKQDSSLASWLLSTISPRILSSLVGSETSTSIWSTIVRRYSKLSTTRIMHLHFRLRSLKKAICGGYHSKEPYTFDAAISLLIDAESRINDPFRFPIGINNTECKPVDKGLVENSHTDPPRSYARRGGDRAYNDGRYKGRSRPQCQLCGKVGHLVDRCWYRFDHNYKPNQSRNEGQENSCCCNHKSCDVYSPFVPEVTPANSVGVQNATLVNANASTATVKWFPDFGATHHVTSDQTQVSTGQQYIEQGKVHIGDCSFLSISRIGQSTLNGNSRDLVLDQVLLVPQITRSLLSVSKFSTDNSVFFEFHASCCYVKDERIGDVLLSGAQEKGLYHFDLKAEYQDKVWNLCLPSIYCYWNLAIKEG
ncbi:hypothetical protein GQ457_16G015660 [Hibiscus cannabinus]